MIPGTYFYSYFLFLLIDAAVEVRGNRLVGDTPPEAVAPLVAIPPLLSHLTVQCLAALSREVVD